MSRKNDRPSPGRGDRPMSRVVLSILLGGSAAGMTTRASARSESQQVDDAIIERRVLVSLGTDPVVGRLDFEVDTCRGVVTLRGLAREPAHSERAETIARATPGVRGVVNRLRVQPDASGVVSHRTARAR